MTVYTKLLERKLAEKDEFAKQKAIGFTKWLGGEGWSTYDLHGSRWIKERPDMTNNVKTVEELYEQFLKEQAEK